MKPELAESGGKRRLKKSKKILKAPNEDTVGTTFEDSGKFSKEAKKERQKHEEIVKGKYAKGSTRRVFPASTGKPGKVGKVGKHKAKKVNTAAELLEPSPESASEFPKQLKVDPEIDAPASSNKLKVKYGNQKRTKSAFPKQSNVLPDGEKPKSSNKLKRKQSNQEGDTSPKKAKLDDMTRIQMKLNVKLARKKKENKFYEISTSAKAIWEELRCKSCAQPKREQLLDKLAALVKGNIKQLIFAHDMARVIECMTNLGTPKHRNLLFDEVKDVIIPMSKSKYAKFIVQKLLKNGTPEQKQYIVRAFNTHVVSLLHNVEAASVLETIYNEHANALQRSQLLQEFYSRELALFKEDKVVTLKDVLATSSAPEKVLETLKESLMKIIDKPVLRHSIVHHVLLEFLKNADATSRSEMVHALAGSVVEVLHTKDGSRVAMQCVWHGTAKDRKAIVKSFKTHVAKIAKEEHGYMVLLSIFDYVDDTKLVESTITAELLKEPFELMTSPSGQKVLSYLVSPRDSRIFHPQVVDILKEGDASVTSKKDPEVRKEELRKAPAKVLAQMIADNAEVLMTHNGPTAIATSVILSTLRDGEGAEAFRSIGKLLAESPYQPSRGPDASHLFDRNHARFFLKKMASLDKKGKAGSFSTIIAEEVPGEVMASWTDCNFGAFFLVQLLETRIPEVVNKVKTALAGKRSALKKSELKGVELLQKMLAEG